MCEGEPLMTRRGRWRLIIGASIGLFAPLAGAFGLATAAAGATQVRAGTTSPVIQATLPPQFSLDIHNVYAFGDLPSLLEPATIIPGTGSPATTYAATVDWGDGSPISKAIVLADGAYFIVEGIHSYLGTGVFTLTTTVTASTGPSQSATSIAFVRTPPHPRMTGATPGALGQGVTTTLSLTGNRFTDNNSATVSFSAAGVVVDSVTFDAQSKLRVKVSVSRTAAIGSSDITVTTPGGHTRCSGCLTIDAHPTVTSVTGSLTPGTTSVVTVLGTGFAPGLSVKTDIPGTTAGVPTGIMSTSFAVSITVPSTVAVGDYHLIVTNIDLGAARYPNLSVS